MMKLNKKLIATTLSIDSFSEDVRKLGRKYGLTVNISNFEWYYPTVNINVMDINYVDFGDISLKYFGMFGRFGSRYINGINGRPCLGYDLRFIGNDDDCYSWQIHKDDVEEFNRRFVECRHT